MRHEKVIHRMLPALALTVALCSGVALGGCATVAPYERARLADPSMEPEDAVSVARDHTYAIQEGAMGGTVGAASGCGCN